MRATLRPRFTRVRELLARFNEESAWVPIAGKALGIALSLALLAFIGAGHLDRTFDLGPPRALAAARSHRAPEPATSSSSERVAAPLGPSASPATSARAKPAADDRPVVLNEATAKDLERLPGVGPSKAQAIVALREKLGGRFKRFEDLLRVRGIKRRALLKIREQAVLDAPAPDAPPAAPPPSGSGVHSPPPQPAPAAAPRSW